METNKRNSLYETNHKHSPRGGGGGLTIKVCGMRDADNIRALDEAKIADWVGFIFYPKSSRHVGDVPSYLPKNLRRVGVFVNYSIEEIRNIDSEFAFNLIQLHGNEDAEYCRQIRATFPDKKIIKMIQISSVEDINDAKAFEGIADYFLFETKCNIYGGSGQQFNWNLLQSYKGNTPFLITGGISPEDADKIKSFNHPQFAGIDLNSKFEIRPAYKDIELLKNFIKQLR